MNKKKFSFSFSNRFSSHEKELFVKRLSFLLKAGIPILQGLTMIKEQTRSNKQKKVIESLMNSVANGRSLHASLKRFRNIFGDFIINIIRIGENTGLLHQNLNYLAEELKKRRLLKRKIIGALIYPIFIAATTIGITTMLIVFVFPKILPILKGLDVPLPITTRFLISLSGFLTNYGFYVLGGLIVFSAGIFFISKLPKVRLFIDILIPSIPIIGQILQNYHLVNICRTLGLLLKSEVTLNEGIKITAETTSDMVYKKMLGKMRENILKGKKVADQFENYPRFFPILITQMLAVGETTGDLSGSLLYLAEFYETEVDEMTKNLSNILEPLLMIFMGTIVGFVVISIITPIYGVTQHLNVR
jgi:type IV pilus assembly protein PilC